MTDCRVSRSTTGLAAANFGVGATRRTVARPSVDRIRMYIQPMSNSYHFDENFAELRVGVVVVVQFLAADQDAPGTTLVLASALSQLR